MPHMGAGGADSLGGGGVGGAVDFDGLDLGLGGGGGGGGGSGDLPELDMSVFDGLLGADVPEGGWEALLASLGPPGGGGDQQTGGM